MSGLWTKKDQEWWDNLENQFIYNFNLLFTSGDYWERTKENVAKRERALRKLYQETINIYKQKQELKMTAEQKNQIEDSFEKLVKMYAQLEKRIERLETSTSRRTLTIKNTVSNPNGSIDVFFIDQDIMPINIIVEAHTIGTIEPIHKESDKDNYDLIGFVRGFVEKHRDINLTKQDIFDYLDKLVVERVSGDFNELPEGSANP